ncbi:hypothetical protein NSTCB13_03561 [Nostoc sp. DSM 114160]
MDKVRLIQQIAPDIKRELTDKLSTFPRQSLWGLCADLANAPSTEEIDIGLKNGLAFHGRIFNALCCIINIFLWENLPS